ncbi:hypothetical protein [Mycoplasmopsis arginini]|uniref:Uncharacterized protein n=1 Tax=Mycoplasmopsis arginini TaxID=2094 RepID=A0AA43QXS5_MYCAR|nr:hypothetical protein [Mycoplasmopsis arginini]MDI3349939.1 hypothetical protein [Mycoplasmopsis arginini]
MKNTKQSIVINKVELLDLLLPIEKSTLINLVSETKLRMNKRNNPYFDKVIKKSKCNFLIGNDYQTRVQKNESKEGLTPDFISEENKVGNHVSKCVLFNEKTQSHYLQVERFDEIKPKVEYIFEGNQIDKMLFNDFMVKVSNTSRQDQERKVNVLSYKLDSIKEISLNGQKYVVQD